MKPCIRDDADAVYRPHSSPPRRQSKVDVGSPPRVVRVTRKGARKSIEVDKSEDADCAGCREIIWKERKGVYGAKIGEMALTPSPLSVS